MLLYALALVCFITLTSPTACVVYGDFVTPRVKVEKSVEVACTAYMTRFNEYTRYVDVKTFGKGTQLQGIRGCYTEEQRDLILNSLYVRLSRGDKLVYKVMENDIDYQSVAR